MHVKIEDSKLVGLKILTRTLKIIRSKHNEKIGQI